ncbi:MAG: peptidoglycan DD-metalloendopeptidase family protein [Arcobacteraceae bacterium]|jgi:murein DD-endopeptidase MepM/ murein hydrolase activator NlpD|nr:peptidoglycan DD-metalloendopeptidase family protein [Arcobacteraceae bacterium]
MKLFVTLFFIAISLFGADIKKIDQKIKYNKNILDAKKEEQTKTNEKIKVLANALSAEEDKYNTIDGNLKKISANIATNKIKLEQAKQDIEILNQKSKSIEQYKTSVEEKIVKSVVDKYTTTIGRELLDKKTIKEIIEKEKFKLIFENSKDNIMKSNIEYFQVTNQKNDNDAKRLELERFISDGKAEEKKFIDLKKAQEASIESLKSKHSDYQKELKAIVKKQNQLNSLLSQLNIVKETELEKIKRAELQAKRAAERKAKEEERRAKKAQSDGTTTVATDDNENKSKDIKVLSREILENDSDLKVRNMGNTNQGIKLSDFKDVKMQQPLTSYTVIKKFGSYVDPVYKIELFNESVSLKSNTKNEKVYSALKGQVVYAKNDAGSLGNVVILKHSGDIHTIYSQLSQIAPTLSVGKVIPQGYVVGRVEDTLVFQATKNNRYLNPLELF